jgi:hypothetical protein
VGETADRGRDGGARARRRVAGEAAGGRARARRGHGLGTAGARLGRGEGTAGHGLGAGVGAAAAAPQQWRGHGGSAAAWRGHGGVATTSERVRKKKSLPALCTRALLSARDRALDKDFFNLKIRLAECQIGGTRQRLLCRVFSGRHSTKIIL